MSSEHDQILVVDFGSQVTQLIARRIRELSVYCEIHPFNSIDAAFLERFKPKGIILSGGPASVHGVEAPAAHKSLFELNVPILGICYGEQTLVQQLGGDVQASDHREFGRAFVEIKRSCSLFENIWAPGNKYEVWMSHGDRVNRIPDGFDVVGVSDASPFAIIANEEKKYFGVQFHPEVVHTPDGKRLLENFTHKICKASGDWSMASFKAVSYTHLTLPTSDLV